MDLSELRRLRAEAVAICQKNRYVLWDQDAERLTEIVETIWEDIVSHGVLDDEVRREARATVLEIMEVLQWYFLYKENQTDV